MSATVHSVYFKNIHPDVVAAQARVVKEFLPEGWQFNQYCHEFSNQELFPHAVGLQKCLDESKTDINIFLDIDCIPLKQKAFTLLELVAEKGCLGGCVQRANHIENGGHLYIGPFCMALSRKTYKAFGSPTFKVTPIGDIGEQLTYVWEENKAELVFLWPSKCRHAIWKLDQQRGFGLNTTYEELFYHSFCIRDMQMQSNFIHKCNSVLSTVLV